ncbi:MAG TPA: undecaprenyl/decaprenyl-phosphate alpha-N-acetylglucosaminyl 1-phosphate transferase, partial [Gammaproteobacteria bacterium]|nr:undecaprenyl/decaprenyl-phosphate alpha-N-acetylglucosaminyl 1-phosphate transferase [Gammaproteobacteria bacterium]
MSQNVSMSFALGLVVTVLMVGLLRPVAMHIGLIDRPGERKVHSEGVPLVGGLAMFCGFVLAALTLDQALTPYRSFFAA